MSSRSFRKRPITFQKKMKIFRNGSNEKFTIFDALENDNASQASELRDRKAQGASKKEVSSESTSNSREIAVEENGTGTLQNQRRGVVVNIPVPPIQPVRDYRHEVSVGEVVDESTIVCLKATPCTINILFL